MAAALGMIDGAIMNTPFSPLCLLDGCHNNASSSSDENNFAISDYVAFEESSLIESAPAIAAFNCEARLAAGDHGCATDDVVNCENMDAKRRRVGIGCRIGFRMKSEVEILDDGFKWRKYGKKSVKNSPNPRNYFRCSSEGCGVKKRVERDREDAQFVITTYEGVHNHTSPWMTHATVSFDYAHLPISDSTSDSWQRIMPTSTPSLTSNYWTLMQSSSSSSSQLYSPF